MAIAFNREGLEAQRSGVLPPWLWFWLVLYILEFPAVFDRMKTNLLILLTGNDGINQTLVYNVLERVPTVVEILLDLVLFVGIITVFLPWVRTIFLQRRYGLTEPQNLSQEMPQETLLTLREVSAFVRGYAPRLILTYNVSGKLLTDRAFVYPIGYRKAGMAVSGSLLTLWTMHPQDAQAILLHEIAHYRHGDMLVVGAGSLLQTVIKYWLRITCVFVIVPLLISLVVQNVLEFQAEKSLSIIPLPTIIIHRIEQIFVLDLPSTLLIFFQSFFWTASLFTLVTIAIWCAEINADRFVIDTTQSLQVLAKAMGQHAASSSWLNWLWSGVYHPPRALRQWLVQRSVRVNGLTLVLLIFPTAWFIRLLFLLCWAVSQYLMFLYIGTSTGYIIDELSIDVVYFFEAIVPSWIAIAVLVLLWPILTRYWEHIFSNITSQPVNARYFSYLFSTVFVVFFCIVGGVLSVLPQPTEPTGLTPVLPYSTANTASGHFKVGDTAKIGNLWLITVINAQMKGDNGLAPAKAGSAFLAINVSLKNISPQTNTLASDLQFVLQDVHGKTYDETYFAATLPPAVAQNGDVAAGATAQGQLNYEVPLSISQFTLSFKADWKNYNPQTSKLTVWDISTPSSVVATATTVIIQTPAPGATSSPGTPIGNYPVLQQSYQGKLVNTTDNNNTSADAALSAIVQVQGNISGNMTIQLPLAGSGPFTGTVSSNGAIQFTVIPTDNSGYADIIFTGTIHSDGSMSGSYTLPGTTQGGTWQFKPM